MTIRYTRYAAVLPLIAAVACSNFLTGDKLSSDPNTPQTPSRFLLLNGIQATQFTNQTGAVARSFGIFTQQFSGTDRQYASLEEYAFVSDDYDNTFSSTYAAGGLVDIRKLQGDARAANDLVFLGIGEVWEALTIGTAATIWGDIPYREAASLTVKNPHFDPQAQVFADVQKVLDSAIVHLNSGSGPGPGPYDLIYGAATSSPASVQKWVAAAHTLKARFYMHMAEKDPANYARAITEANSGILTRAGDFTTYQSSTPGEENIWYQFAVRERDTYIRAGANLVNLLKARSDPRLDEYFAPNSTGQVVGAKADSGDTGASTLSAVRSSPGFRQPLITAEENLLLRAEAEYQTSQFGPALTDLNAARALDGLGPVVAAGTALLEAIAEEEYVALFQSIEVMALYSRTCYPNIAPVGGGNTIPRRVYYGTSEVNANPNVPTALDGNLFNPNDKAGGSLAAGAACLGQGAGAP